MNSAGRRLGRGAGRGLNHLNLSSIGGKRTQNHLKPSYNQLANKHQAIKENIDKTTMDIDIHKTTTAGEVITAPHSNL